MCSEKVQVLLIITPRSLTCNFYGIASDSTTNLCIICKAKSHLSKVKLRGDVKNISSFIKDTNNFLRKLRNLPTLPDDVLLCTVDVLGLYPNIPHQDGLAALHRVLDVREDKSVSTETLMDLAECVLQNNVFEHNNRFFRQLQGTAIGTKMAPSYANIFMSDLEEQFLESSMLKPLVWWRYIDDIFMLWQHGEDKLIKFLELLNSCHPTIKFTHSFSRDSVNFLDVKVIRKDNHLITDLYVKPTDTHQYLQASSCHVPHSIRGIAYSQALQLNRICSEGEFFDKRCNELESWLQDRGHRSKMVRKQVLRARKFRQDDLLNTIKTRNNDNKFTFNITYHPAFMKIRRTLSKIHLLLTPNEEHRKVFPNVPIVGFKKGKSLQDFLVRAKLPEIREKANGCRKCGANSCDVYKKQRYESENVVGEDCRPLAIDPFVNGYFVAATK
ncbi:uncharacterized protein LOC130625148 [Hydractinia symbiolongicarpus]|uniref:uncharacterized protein LOC130625148 n=1 Tax=Hydractinia symbiolongicarpus TaxID=13093 RepID=UPI00254B3A8E|nr:uncharacterized protein LOC130625148 [Hydractinia symbiolongicarpus]